MNVHDYAARLPEPEVLRDRCRALAMLEAIISPDWEWRYHSFDAEWSPGVEMASRRNGSGDEWSIVFAPAGVFIRGFDHEAPMSPVANDNELWPGLLDGLPDALREFADEPAFSFDDQLNATFVLWRTGTDPAWRVGAGIEFPAVGPGRTPDGSDQLELLCDDGIDAFVAFATDYYDDLADLDAGAVAHVFALRPLTDEIVAAINPDLTLDDVEEDRATIGYPS